MIAFVRFPPWPWLATIVLCVQSFSVRTNRLMPGGESTLARKASVLASDSSAETSFPEGSMNGHYVVEYYKVHAPFDWTHLAIDQRHVERLELQPTNITLPVALLLAEDAAFESLSQARKACRKGNVFLQRNGANTTGRVGDRIVPGDLLARQIRLASTDNDYTANIPYAKPPFDLPVVYEDDIMALVNKPSGVVTYRQGSGSSGLLSVRAALPFVLTPPRTFLQHMLRRPATVHRLDKATSGLLVIAKTKPAMIKLSRQFHDRQVQKTYHAIVMGIPEEDWNISLSSEDVKERYGIDVGMEDDPSIRWQVIDQDLDGKNAVTIWRATRYVKSLVAGDLTMVEMHPKTGRYHQLRRHMAWFCNSPIVGDTKYDGGTPMAMKFRENGLFLCSSRITLNHLGGKLIEAKHSANRSDDGEQPSFQIYNCSETRKPLLSATVPLPKKFSTLLQREEARFEKLSEDSPP